MPSARAVTSQKQHHVRRRLTREQSLNGWTHGHRAASCDDRDGWHAWWHTGRDINALTHHGESIGMIAARHGSRYIFDAWCRHGGHLNASTPDGDTIPRILLLRMEQSWKEKEMMASLSMQCQTDDARNHYWEREQEHFMMYTMVTRMLCDAVTHGANILPFMYPTLQMDHRVHDALMKTMRDGMHQHAALAITDAAIRVMEKPDVRFTKHPYFIKAHHLRAFTTDRGRILAEQMLPTMAARDPLLMANWMRLMNHHQAI